MITELRIRRWRAYQQLDLELGPGTTFIVAANGVGKSSLLEAATWALFGEASGVDPISAISAGNDTAEVALTLTTIDGNLRIQRRVDRQGKVELDADHDAAGPIETESDYLGTVESALGASLPIAARLTFLTDKGALSSSQGEFPIKDHLAATFGVQDLLLAASEAESHRKVAERDRKKLRSAATTDAQELDKAQAELDGLESQLADAEREHIAALERLAAAQAQLQAAERWAGYRREVATREEQLAAFAESVRTFIGLDETVTDPEKTLAAAEEAASRHLDETRARSVSDTARAEAVVVALDNLSSSAGTCPTCLRPIDDGDVSEAVAKHEAHHRDLERAIGGHQQRVSALEDRLAELRKLSRHLAVVPALPQPPDSSEGAADVATVAVPTAQEQVNVAADALERLRIRHGQLASTIKEAAVASQARRDQVIAFRREAIAEAARDTLQNMADVTMATSIGPLTEEVAHRWKYLFGTGEGLQLHPDGSITMERNGQTLNFNDLSGGEQVSSLLVTRLLVLTASTTARFAWLDEPLEHLDPIRRHTMAAALAKAAESSHLDQIIVTTFDEELARRLAASRPSVTLEYVRT